MEGIRQAVERAKRSKDEKENVVTGPARQDSSIRFGDSVVGVEHGQRVQLNIPHLQSQRIVAHDGRNQHSRPFDVLRTEVLRSMDLKGWKTLAVTSPTPCCGKTTISVNLALSMARRSERSVRLVDLDFRNPHIAKSLGLKCRDGALGVVEGRSEIRDAIFHVNAGNSSLEVLPTVSSSNSSDLFGSNAMSKLLRDATEYRSPQIVIFDLPPLLAGHDVISILPQVDCVLLTAAVGTTKRSQIEECNKHLQSIDVVRVVLNKVEEQTAESVYY